MKPRVSNMGTISLKPFMHVYLLFELFQLSRPRAARARIRRTAITSHSYRRLETRLETPGHPISIQSLHFSISYRVHGRFVIRPKVAKGAFISAGPCRAVHRLLAAWRALEV